MIYSYYDEGLKKKSTFTEKSRRKLLLAYGLYREYGIKDSRVIHNSFGKPMLKEYPDLFISFTHSKKASAVIISKKRVGIDLEKVRPHRKEAASRILHEKEQMDLAKSKDQDVAFFQLFTLKESYIKALGCGFSYPVKTLNFKVNEKSSITWNKTGAKFILKEDTRGHILSICHLR